MSKYVAILAGGRIGIHAHSSNGNTATLCGMDGDDPHPAVDQKIVSVPANAMFKFLPSSLNCSDVIIIPSFLNACSCVFIVRSSRVIRMFAVASWLSIGSSEIDSVLKL